MKLTKNSKKEIVIEEKIVKPVMLMNMNALSKNVPNPNLGPLEEIVIEIKSFKENVFVLDL